MNRNGLRTRPAVRAAAAGVLCAASAVAISLPAASAAGTSTINFWIFDNPPMVTVTKQLAAQYEKLHPGVTVDLTVLPNASYEQKYTVALSTGTGPDGLLVSNSDIPALASSHELAPVDFKAFGFASQAALVKAWMPGSLAGLTWGTGVYGIPMEFDTFSLFINTQDFKAIGLNPTTQYPKTWTELEQDAQKLAVYKNGQLVREGFDWPYFTAGWEMLVWYPILRQYGGNVLSANGKSAVVDSAAGVKAVDLWVNMIKKYKAGSPSFAVSTPTDPNQAFIENKQAMWITGPWAIPTITKGTAAYGHYEVVPLPQVNPKNPIAVLYSWNWAVNAHAHNAAGAWSFINFLSEHEVEWLKTCGYIQPRIGWYNTTTAKDFPYLSVFRFDQAHGIYVLPSLYNAQITTDLGNALEAALEQGVPAKTALSQADQAIDRTLSQGG
jgi:multiple sugar transport system substrate-binding protein